MHSNPNREKMNEMTAMNLRKGMGGKIILTHSERPGNRPNNSKDCTLRSHRKGK